MSNAWLALVAALTGAAVMVLELMAVRLMAPWFGQSQPVWTNVIGVVLAALAAGQWLGGRWAESGSGLRPSVLLMVAGAWSLGLPDIVAFLGAAVVPTALPLLEAYPFVTWGSLLVSLVSLGLPLLALGAMTPWLVRLSLDVRDAPGRVTGRLLGAGTLGSLVGTFGATHLLLATVGSAWAVRVAGGLLLLVALIMSRLENRKRSAARLAVLLLPLAAAALPGGGTENGEGGGTLLETRETPYQLARVVEWEDGTRVLRLNEGLDSFHSLYAPDRFWSGTYFDAFLGPALLSPRSADGVRDVLVIGLAAGTMARQLLQVEPSARVRGVEIDAEIVELGRRWFDLPEAVDVVAGVDGRIALASDPGSYGAILIDAYAQQIYLPAHLCTEEFFQSVYDHLLEGGVAALNIGGMGREDPVVNAVAGTFGAVFDGALIGRVPGTRNMLLMGFRGATPARARWEASLAATELPPLEDGVGGLDWLWNSGLMNPVDVARGGPLRDGAAPVEALAHASWRGQRLADDSATEAVALNGDAALEVAGRLIAQTRLSAAEHVLAELLREANLVDRAYAHLLLGNIAFERGEFETALLEYTAAGADLPDPPVETRGIAATARDNADLARPSAERQERLAGARGRIQVAVLAVLGVALLGVGLLARRARA